MMTYGINLHCCNLFVLSRIMILHSHNRGLFFGDYMAAAGGEKAYDEVKDFTELTSTIEK